MIPTGPKNAKLMFLAEAPGAEEIRQGIPLVGESGKEFGRMLAETGIERDGCRLDNVFYDRPPANKLHDEWCETKKIVELLYWKERDYLVKAEPDWPWPNTYTWSSIGRSKYLRPEFLLAIPRLHRRLLEVKPNLLVLLGAVAAWAVIQTSTITKIRGTVRLATLVPGLKVLPTFHPAYVLRDWSARTVVLYDLIKAKRQREFPDIRRPQREIHINASVPEMYEFFEKYLRNAEIISYDTETAHKQITCISFAVSIDRAIVVNFVDYTKPGYNHYDTMEEEVAAWRFVFMVLNTTAAKLAQNGLYDMQYLWVKHGIPVKNPMHDTMLLHHALYIEMVKNLGFLGSIYTDEAAWKLMRVRGKDEVEKKDD